MYTLAIDDLCTSGASRFAVRERLDYFLETGEAPKTITSATGSQVTSIKETPQERQERLRASWGHDDDAQRRWRL